MSAEIDAIRRRERNRRRRDLLLAVGCPILLLAGWQLAARLDLIDAQLFPPPSAVLARWAQLAGSGELREHVSATLYRLSVGYFSGACGGVVVGCAMGRWRPVAAALGPLFSALYALPKVAVLPLLLLIFGLTETPKILSVAITVFFVLQINTFAGMRQIDPRILEAATAYRAVGWRLWRFVLLPTCLPAIFTGLRIAAGLGVAVVIAVEFVAANSGIGYLIWNSWQLFQPERMYAGLLTAALLGACLTGAITAAEFVAMPWRRSLEKISGRKQ
ncbi:ABC transporter permease [Nocardia brasiliensis]|uniref:ABC transporter permease n=1 Tax=Nocardia brasiliensis TaxID=37326 RepID=UPI0037AA570B